MKARDNFGWKKFNIGAPDEYTQYKYYWHDLGKETKQYFSRQMGSRWVNVLKAFVMMNCTTYGEYLDVRILTPYQVMLHDHLMSFESFLGGPNWMLQQDHASCHASKATLEWFKKEKVNVLLWPSRSPDLNSMGNLWGMLYRKFYANKKQYLFVNVLKVALGKEWQIFLNLSLTSSSLLWKIE